MDERKIYSDGVHSIANDEYHSSSGVSRSSLWEFKRSPYHYWHRYLNGGINLQESTPSMVMGNLVHTMVLEPHKFDSEFVMRPEMDRRTNAGKQAFNAFTMTLAGRQGVTYEQVAEANAIQKAIIENDLAFALLQDCKIEQSIYFTHESTGIQIKCRPDAWNGSIVVDLKTTASANYRDFQNSVFKYGYDTQAAIIKLALASINISLEKFVFIAVEKEPPYAVGIYVLDEEVIDYGIRKLENLLVKYSECLQDNKWPSYPIQTILLPKWADFGGEE